MEGRLPEFYTWRITEFGFTPHERIERQPTRAELEKAVVIVIRFENVSDPKDIRWTTVRHPVGFGVLPFRTLMEDIQQAVIFAAERYQFELVES